MYNNLFMRRTSKFIHTKIDFSAVNHKWRFRSYLCVMKKIVFLFAALSAFVACDTNHVQNTAANIVEVTLHNPIFPGFFQDYSGICPGFGRINDSSRCKGLTCNGLLLAFGILKVEKIRVSWRSYSCLICDTEMSSRSRSSMRAATSGMISAGKYLATSRTTGLV